jgi:hypothetical protein
MRVLELLDEQRAEEVKKAGANGNPSQRTMADT